LLLTQVADAVSHVAIERPLEAMDDRVVLTACGDPIRRLRGGEIGWHLPADRRVRADKQNPRLVEVADPRLWELVPRLPVIDAGAGVAALEVIPLRVDDRRARTRRGAAVQAV